MRSEATRQVGAGAAATKATYHLRSTVLGAVVTEYNGQGQRQTSYTYAAGGVLTETGRTYEGGRGLQTIRKLISKTRV